MQYCSVHVRKYHCMLFYFFPCLCIYMMQMSYKYPCIERNHFYETIGTSSRLLVVSVFSVFSSRPTYIRTINFNSNHMDLLTLEQSPSIPTEICLILLQNTLGTKCPISTVEESREKAQLCIQ